MEPLARIQISAISDLVQFRSGRTSAHGFYRLIAASLTIIVARGGRIAFAHAAANVFIADYVLLDIGSGCSLLVISNGRSLTTHQALA